MTKREQKHLHWQILAVITLISANLIAFTAYKALREATDVDLTTYTKVVKKPHHRDSVASQAHMISWVLNEVEDAGLNSEEVDCLIEKESRWDQWALNDNSNGAGVDRGLFQFSSIWHKEISNEEAFDYKKATKHFIRIAKADGNFNQWHGYKKCK